MKILRFQNHFLPLCAGALFVLATQTSNAQNNAQALADGKAFAKTMLPTSKANPVSATANPSSSLTTNKPINSPLYTTNQPASGGFTSGIGIVTQGSTAISKCQSSTPTGDAMIDQECAGVNFLANNPVQAQFIIQENDPIRTAFKNAAEGAINADVAGQQCIMKTVITPGVYENAICSQSLKIDTLSCNKILNPACAYVASPMSYLNIASSGVISGSLSPLAEEGTYSFSINTYGGCPRPSGTSLVEFNLDSIGFGSYIDINMNWIDDTGAVAVNGIPVWAGYPNAGPAYTYAALGSPTTASYVRNYSWTETNGGRTATFSADTKILDYCPSGYAPTPLATSFYPSNTRQFKPGFFCNGNGQFLMNGHEGNGGRSAALGKKLPLKRGLNKIEVFWSTNPYDDGCGTMTVTGTIHNVAPKCESVWEDGCAIHRSALVP